MDAKGITWDPQLLILTPDKLLISKADDTEGTIFDEILLRDVIECELKDVDVLEIDEDEEDALLEVIFRTTEEGFNCGRSYIYRSVEQNSRDWESQVDDAVEDAKKEHVEQW